MCYIGQVSNGGVGSDISRPTLSSIRLTCGLVLDTAAFLVLV